jgi:hypothetical protein
MKIFWSWQSDTPGNTGRHFIRKALLDAIAVLKQPEDIEEPTQVENRESMHLDQDRQGVTGSPDLVNTILDKIEKSRADDAERQGPAAGQWPHHLATVLWVRGLLRRGISTPSMTASGHSRQIDGQDVSLCPLSAISRDQRAGSSTQ